ncbi:MAG: BMP family ABC transporter substrate-binding protein [Eubacteriales bacterium]|nr:BMP family ABC transporter substrate-binding protein [Eubacteriales bacterium]
MKKLLSLFATALVIAALLSGCAGAKVKVGVVTDAGNIDDGAWNQAAWAGVLQAEEESLAKKNYVKPTGTSKEELQREIDALYEKGYRFIVLPGAVFANAAAYAQDKYQDAQFVLLDAQPVKDDGQSVIAVNTVAVEFAAQQAGFAAGVATAVQLGQGSVGFVGDVQQSDAALYCAGFRQGLEYAHNAYQTAVTMTDDDIAYTGAPDDVAMGQKLAAQLYDKGCVAVFAAAGKGNVGVITEAKLRLVAGAPCWVIGSGYDQYADGAYEENKSVVLTSAVKKMDVAVYEQIKAASLGQFAGGTIIVFQAENDGVGIPATNPNLGNEAVTGAADALAKMKAGQVTVTDTYAAPDDESVG